MKKIVMIFAAMAAVLSSCQKSELESVSANEGKDIVLNISVSNPGAGDTRALIKTGWAKDDEISIWYDSNVQETPDLVVTYNGEKWIQKEGATVSGNTPSTGTGKYAKALYNGTVKVASKDDYTYENSTLTFSIENWKFLTEVQVVVKGLTSASAGNYTLACDKFTPLAAGNGYTVSADGITASKGDKSTAVTGISNADGVAFVFATADYSATTAAYKFTLTDNTSTPAVTKEYTATTNKISGTSGAMAAIKALTIAKDKFRKAAPTGFVDLGVKDADGKPLFWAEKNLGASKPEEYGKYYSWGDVTGQTPSGSTFSTSFGWDNDKFGQTFDKVAQNDACPSGVLAHIYDAAYQANNSWRMPTKEDFTELAKQCFLEWTKDYNSTSVKGVIVWKAKGDDAGWFKPSTAGKGQKIKDDGSGYAKAVNHTFSNTYNIDTDSYVFFPAAGYGGTNLYLDGSEGYYVSSSLKSSEPDKAYYLDFYNSNVKPQSGTSRCAGFSVRPVSN